MTTLKELIAAAKALDAPSREIDAKIHAFLFGTVDAAPVGLTYRDAFDPLCGHPNPYRFTGSFEGAEMALPGPDWPEYQVTSRFGTGYHANVGTGAYGVGYETAALALLVAALESRDVHN